MNSVEFYRPWLDRNRLSFRIYNQLAIADGYRYKGKNISALLGQSKGSDGKFMRNNPFIFDMFGVIDDNGIFELPKKVGDSFLDVCFRRAAELGSCTIAWSGGIDSTFLLAVFAYLNIPVKTATVYKRVVDGEIKNVYFKPKLKKYILNHFENIEISAPRMYSRYLNGERILDYSVEPQSNIPLVTAAWADGLFFSNQRLKGDMEWWFEPGRDGQSVRKVVYKTNKFLPLADYLECCLDDTGKRVFSDKDIEILVDYGNRFGKPLDSRNRIARFLYWISVLPDFMFDSTLKYMPNLTSFFCTQNFLNLAYSSYWDMPNSSNIYPRDKRIELDFIRKVFGSDFGVESNW